MTREKMMELWKKEFENSYYQWNLTPQVYEYLDEKTDHLVGSGTVGSKYYAYYEDWLVRELDGENAELARRMLVVISKIRTNGLISSFYNAGEVKVCLRIGYDFESILKQGIIRHGSNIKPSVLYQVAELMAEYCPNESVEFADQLLTDKFAAWKKQNADFGLALYIAVVMLKKDATGYSRYLPALVSAVEKGGDYVLYMLYKGYALSPELKDILLQRIQTKASIVRSLNFMMEKSDVPFLLKDIGAPMWPYYYLVATDVYSSIDRASVLLKLFNEDKQTYLDTCSHLFEDRGSWDAAYGLFMLAVLMKHGEGESMRLAAEKVILSTMVRLLNEYNNNGNQNRFTAEEIMDEHTTADEWRTKLSVISSLSWGRSRIAVGAFGLLYEYIPLAKRFIDILLLQPKKAINMNNVSCVIAQLVTARKDWLHVPARESIQMLLNANNEFTMKQVFKAYSYFSSALDGALSREDVMEHEPMALELLTSGELSIEETIEWLKFIYATCEIKEYQPLIGLLSNKSKMLRKEAEALIADNEESVRPTLEKQFPKLKGDALAAAKRLLKRWDNERKFGAGFTFTNETVIEYCTDNNDKDNAKYISWIPENMMTDVRFADLSETVPAVVIQYILSEYMSLEEPYKIKACDMVVAQLHPQDFQAALENIYQFWKDNGAEAKKKMVMVPYCIYASDTQILALKNQLRDWADASRGAIAAFVVNAIAMNGGSVALMMIDGMSVKFPNNQVKNAAKAAFSFAAKALEIPEDELSDKIVPTLGFNKEGEKELDYGPRTFKITLMPDFSLSIFDNDKQKTIKSMPAPGANDDTVKATAAKKEFSELKKQMKATVQTQTNRLEKVLMNGRRWTVDAWNTLFVENPIMHRFATGLVWGVYDGDTLVEAFRYMDDGTFNTVDEDEYELPEKASITLVHPIDLSAETLARWKEQLDDYEVVQPLPQLTAPVVTLDSSDRNGKRIIRYNGIVALSGKIAGMAKKYNMVRGEVLDAGSYTCFHWVDKCLNVAAQLNFEYMYMGQEYNDTVTLGEVLFYRLGEDQLTDDEPKDNVLLDVSDVPSRFVSSVLGVFDQLKSE